MARQPRFILPGYPQHIIQRGNNRSVIFADDADYLFYLDWLKAACECFDCRIHAYILMTNHVHLLLTPATGMGIGKVMQSVGRCYVQYFNWRYPKYRDTLRGALQGVTAGYRTLSPDLLPLYQVKPGSGRHSRLSTALPLVKSWL